jgi:lipopolysaccharide biosynthesis glycosyltransferase
VLKIILSIIVDKKYLEPALVTLMTLLKFQKLYKSLKLILIKKNIDTDQDINEILDLINKFKNSFDDNNFIELIIIEDKFPEFTKFHFSNAILYKIFLPVIISTDDFILNVDAGNLFQNGFSGFSENFFHLSFLRATSSSQSSSSS